MDKKCFKQEKNEGENDGRADRDGSSVKGDGSPAEGDGSLARETRPHLRETRPLSRENRPHGIMRWDIQEYSHPLRSRYRCQLLRCG